MTHAFASRRRRSRRRSRSPLTIITTTPALLICTTALALIGMWFGFQMVLAFTAYKSISTDTQQLQSYENREITDLNAADMQTMQVYFGDLEVNFRRIDRATSLPLVGRAVEVLPWIGPRYESGRTLVKTGHLLSSAGYDGAGTGADAMTAFDRTGLSQSEENTGPTWLDIVVRDHDKLLRVADDIREARQLRAAVDTSVLPDGARAKVAQLDRLLDRYDIDTQISELLPAVEAGLGAEGTVRYWVLFPNPAELRPAGGFPGSGALVTFEHGQLVSFEFHDMKQVSEEYLAERTEVIPAPTAIDTYLFDKGFLPHDTVWWSDFPRLGQDFMRMYADIDWPEISGVIAAEPTVVADMLRVTGDMTVNVDGEDREITADNVFFEMERQRARRRGGQAIDTSNKELIALVGSKIVDQLKSADRRELSRVVNYLRDGADRRDIQAYSTNETVLRELDKRAWSGRAEPLPEVPTLSVTYANVVATKASLTMFPETTLHLGETTEGMTDATLELVLNHEGTNEADPYYAGFQRWWVQVDLPDGSTSISGEPAMQTDPDAPDGGAYLIEIFPQQTGTITVKFKMPTQEKLLFRRQPGVNTVKLTVDRGTCRLLASQDVSRDVVIDLAEACP